MEIWQHLSPPVEYYEPENQVTQVTAILQLF